MHKIDFGAPQTSPMATIMDVLGAAATATVPAQPAFKKALSQRTLDSETVMYSMIPGLVAAGAGAFLWKKHRVLGALGGFALGAAVSPVAKDEDRTKVLCGVGATGLGIFASLKWKKHPVLGYIGGAIAGTVLSIPFVK